uniref:Uncharacterized protein n=1 Tax=Chryseobacterium sp. B5 TaxID=2050562 RepID=A0A2G7T6H4_9FLAO
MTLPLTDRRCHPLSGCAASPSLATREGDDALAAGRRGRPRPLLGVPLVGTCCLLEQCMAQVLDDVTLPACPAQAGAFFFGNNQSSAGPASGRAIADDVVLVS